MRKIIAVTLAAAMMVAAVGVEAQTKGPRKEATSRGGATGAAKGAASKLGGGAGGGKSQGRVSE